MSASFAYFAFVVFCGYVVQTVTGFGAMLLCVTLGALVMAIPEIVTMVVPVSLVQTGYIVLRHHDGIRKDLLLTRVLPLMGAGMAAGYLLIAGHAGSGLERAFGVMVVVLAGRELLAVLRAPAERVDAPPSAASHWISGAAMLGAGVVHGVYATGGPLLVYALGKESLDKHAFRSTLATSWLVLNIALTTTFALDGRYDGATLGRMALLVPLAPFGIAIGELVHRRVDERHFKITVFSLLIAAALSLTVR